MHLFTRTEILTNVTMLPIHLVALSSEHVHLGRACRAIEQCSALVFAGIQVDCVYVSPSKKRQADGTKVDSKDVRKALKDIAEHRKHPSGEPVYHLTKAKVKIEAEFIPPTAVTLPSHWQKHPEWSEPQDTFGSWVENPPCARVWTDITEDVTMEPDESLRLLAARCLENKGALLQGGPGTGKTKFIQATSTRQRHQILRWSCHTRSRSFG